MTTLKDTPKNILVPVDFSEQSEKAVMAAGTLARATGATVHLLNAYQIPVEPVGLGLSISQNYVEQFVKDSTAQLQALAARLLPGVAIGPVLVMSGDPREVITDEAKKLGVEAIVMGTHGRRGLTRALIGSVAETVVRTAPCSVLIVR